MNTILVLLIKYADGEMRGWAYEDPSLADAWLRFQLDIHRHVGHDVRVSRDHFQAFAKLGHLVREIQIVRDRRRSGRFLN